MSRVGPGDGRRDRAPTASRTLRNPHLHRLATEVGDATLPGTTGCRWVLHAARGGDRGSVGLERACRRSARRRVAHALSGHAVQGRGGAGGESACTPDSVSAPWCAGGHPSRPSVARRLQRPTRGSAGGPPSPCSALLPVGFAEPPGSPRVLVRSYRTVSPLPVRALARHRRSVLCGTVLRVAPTGCYPAPRPVESGRSSGRVTAPRREGARRGHPAGSPRSPLSHDRGSSVRRRTWRASQRGCGRPGRRAGPVGAAAPGNRSARRRSRPRREHTPHRTRSVSKTDRGADDGACRPARPDRDPEGIHSTNARGRRAPRWRGGASGARPPARQPPAA